MQNRPTVDEAKQIPKEFAYRQKEYESVSRLDSDRVKAMSLMKEILMLDNKLPGFDCGACGSPTCRAFAEDVIKERAELSDCVFLERGEKK
jgi:ArsR family metal-binding transcriptional regulator